MSPSGILYNSEAWHSLSETEIRILETVDEHLLRSLVRGHAKTPLEFLYLEAGATPIRFIISSRRLNYHHCILQREEGELIKRIYNEQKRNPTSGDFVKLIADDFKLIDEEQNDVAIQNTNRQSYKQLVKQKVKSAAFKYLQTKKDTHSKVSHIQYSGLQIQKYMLSPLFANEEVNQLHALRSRSTDCKANFKQKYLNSNLLCALCKTDVDNQQHILRCRVLMSNLETDELTQGQYKYDDIFSMDVKKQKVITSMFVKLFKLRENLQENTSSQPAPSSTAMELRMSDNLHNCIAYSSLGK